MTSKYYISVAFWRLQEVRYHLHEAIGHLYTKLCARWIVDRALYVEANNCTCKSYTLS